MKKKTIIQMVVGILFLLTLIISSTYAYFNIVTTSSNNTTSNYNAKLEDIEKYGTSLLTGGEGELHLRVKASDMTPSKIGNKYYATTSEDDYQLRRGNHIVSKATIQKGLSNYEYNCTSKLTITLDGTMVSEEGLQVGDAKIYLRGTNNNVKNEEYDLKTLIDELDTNSDGKKEYTREIEYLLTSDNEGKVMIDVEFANNSNNQTTSSGKNLNIEITNSELVCGLGNDKVYANLYGNSSINYAYRSNDWKDKIITASFIKSKPSEEELKTKPMYWDLTDTSKSETGSVIGWLEEREETDTYDLYIGSDKEIYATTLNSAFYQMKNLQEIKFDNINTSETTSMFRLFDGCNNLTNINLNNFITSQVTDMNSMFSNCSKLTNLDLSHFDTSNLTSMSSMFIGCKNLISIDITNFDTSKVNSMSQPFRDCNSLKRIIGFDKINTSKVMRMEQMFENCYNLETLDLSGFDTSKVTKMNKMFYNCNNLTNLDVSNFNTSSVTDMSSMFYGCKSLTNLNVSHFETVNVDNMSQMFYGCENLTNLDLSHFDTSNVTRIDSMFYNGTNLKTIDISNFDIGKVTSVYSMFYNTSATIIFPNNFGHNATTMGSMFNNYKGTTLDLSTFDTSSVTSMSNMFSDCNNLTKLDLSKFDTSKVTYMNNMFSGCNNLKTLDLSTFVTSSVTNMSWMFSGLNKLNELDLSNFETPLLNNTQYMFNNCTSLKELKLNKATFDKVTSHTNMFGYSNTSYRVPSDIHLTIKKGQETFINDRLNDAYPNGHNAKIDLVD